MFFTFVVQEKGVSWKYLWKCQNILRKPCWMWVCQWGSVWEYGPITWSTQKHVTAALTAFSEAASQTLVHSTFSETSTLFRAFNQISNRVHACGILSNRQKILKYMQSHYQRRSLRLGSHICFCAKNKFHRHQKYIVTDNHLLRMIFKSTIILGRNTQPWTTFPRYNLRKETVEKQNKMNTI